MKNQPPQQFTKLASIHKMVRNIVIVIAIVIGLLVVGLALHKHKLSVAQNSSTPLVSTSKTDSGSLSAAPTPPPEMASLFNSYKKTIEDYSTSLDSQMPASKHPVTYGAELLVANSNRGTELLQPNAIKGVQLELDRFKELGIQGVTVAVSYPLLKSDYANSSQYLDFYKQVASEVKKRGMKLDVELGVIFANTGFSSLSVDYSKLSLNQYEADQHTMAQTILTNLSPDYLNMGGEAGTLAGLLKQPTLNTPAGFTDYINVILNGLNKGNTLVGAGGASWESTDFSESIAKNTNVDFIDLHIYPLSSTIITNITKDGQIAKQYNKKLVIDETWLYKATSGQAATNVAATADIFKQDVYSFWAPLDQEYIQMIAKVAQVEGADYISPFWTSYFFAYLDYDNNTKGLAYKDGQGVVSKAAVTNMTADKFSSTGLFYKNLIGGQ